MAALSAVNLPGVETGMQAISVDEDNLVMSHLNRKSVWFVAKWKGLAGP